MEAIHPKSYRKANLPYRNIIFRFIWRIKLSPWCRPIQFYQKESTKYEWRHTPAPVYGSTTKSHKNWPIPPAADRSWKKIKKLESLKTIGQFLQPRLSRPFHTATKLCSFAHTNFLLDFLKRKNYPNRRCYGLRAFVEKLTFFSLVKKKRDGDYVRTCWLTRVDPVYATYPLVSLLSSQSCPGLLIA